MVGVLCHKADDAGLGSPHFPIRFVSFKLSPAEQTAQDAQSAKRGLVMLAQYVDHPDRRRGRLSFAYKRSETRRTRMASSRSRAFRPHHYRCI